MLYLVATPIGNLSDISLRALDILSKVDYILCEDTRRSRILLQKHHLKIHLKSFHKFNEKAFEEKVIEDLKNGKEIALISDAGSPLIADPGERLALRCREENLPFTVIPGACSVIAALSLSGFKACPFQFCGFIPKKKSEMLSFFKAILAYSGTSICFESPQRLLKTLELLSFFEKAFQVAIARELTKTFEECRIGTPQELLEHYNAHPPKGEIVLLIENTADPAAKQVLSPSALKSYILRIKKEQNLTLKEAIKEAFKHHSFDKKAIYQLLSKKT